MSRSDPVTTPVLGIDLGGSTIRAGILDGRSSLSDRTRSLLPPDPRLRVDAVLEAVRVYRGRVGAAGMAVAGTVRDGVLTWSANLGLQDVAFAELLRADLGVPVAVLNDARAAGLAEARLGAGADGRMVLVLTVGTGIGGALVLDGRLIEGNGDAGEVGHVRLWEDGVPCGCGRTGCLETRVGGRALERAATALLGRGESHAMTRLEQAVLAGDERATALVEQAAADFARGVDAIAAVLSPDVVVLGGGIMARRGVVATRYTSRLADARWLRGTRITASSLGDDAGQIGAALVASDQLSGSAFLSPGPIGRHWTF